MLSTLLGYLSMKLALYCIQQRLLLSQVALQSSFNSFFDSKIIQKQDICQMLSKSIFLSHKHLLMEGSLQYLLSSPTVKQPYNIESP